jgi:tetratricopeptide (TPR) repeat protein
MKLTFFYFLIVFSVPLASNSQSREPKLLGAIKLADLAKEPYSRWYSKNFNDYIPNAVIVENLKEQKPNQYKIKILMGTWCGDTKRELPRMAKLLSQLSFPESNLELIALNDSAAFYKQGPNHEEAGLGVYRVPTFIVLKNGKEIGRINEFPIETLERDLLKIFEKSEYIPNYASYKLLTEWHKQGLLADDNISARGMAAKLRSIVGNEGELNTAGYVFLRRGDVKEAITIFRINVNLYPQSANCFDSLGEAYLAIGNKEKSILAYEEALKLDPANENVKQQLGKLKAIR